MGRTPMKREQSADFEETTAKRVSRLAPKLSPAQLCHPDHLSQAFSFISPCEMAAASGACRSWHTAGERRTAWPTLDVARFVSDLMRWPSVAPNCVHASLPCSDAEIVWIKAAADLIQIARSRVWTQTHELRVSCCPVHPQPSSTEDYALRLASRMSQLQSLQLHLSAPNLLAVRHCFTALAPRLLCLSSKLDSRSLAVPLSLLPHLRVLELHTRLDLPALRSLHELEFLHLEEMQVCYNVCMVARELSLSDRLRYFSVKARVAESQPVIDLRGLALQSFEVEYEDVSVETVQTALPPASLTSVRVDADMEPGSLYALLTLPQLSELQLNVPGALEELDTSTDVPSLPEAQRLLPPSPLRSLSAPRTVGCDHLPLMLARAPNIERITLQAMPPQHWSSLAQLRSLRELRLLSVCDQTFPTSECMDILAALPQFDRLAIDVQRQRKVLLTTNHLQALSRSRSWHCIELKCPNREWFERNRTVHVASPPEAEVKQLQQLRVLYRSSSTTEEVCFQLQPTKAKVGGNMKWTRASPL